MTDRKLLDASCRVALAAFLHDLGKFAERARIEQAEDKDSEGNTRRDVNVQLYCPHFDGRPTHIHAAYTAIGFDLIERHFPELVGDDMIPFAPWKDRNADDSLINAAAKHHRPETFLQWVIATADRVASGFEREEFEKYNASSEGTATKKNHYTARQLTLFEQIRLGADGAPSKTALAWRYPLRPVSPMSIFPVEAQGYETDDRVTAQREYRQLWGEFVDALEQIPPSHHANLALWLDHFESLWQCFTHAIPAATAGNVKPEVSLYDHSKTAAALAVALWRFHYELADDPDRVRRAMKERADWGEPKLLLIQGDFFGIQDFIFATGGETQRRAAKLLRGRSFYVSLLTECAALKVLDALSLPPTSQVINAAGKFLIVAPNTKATHVALARLQNELDAWFLDHTYGQSGIGLTWLPASCNDFLRGKDQESPFRNLMERLFDQIEEAKLKRFALCASASATPVFAGFLDRFDGSKGECKIDGHSPASQRLEGNTWVSELAYDQVRTGDWLARHDRVLVSREPIVSTTLDLPVLGFHVGFTRAEEITGKFGRDAESGNLLRTWDFSLPEAEDKPLFNGYARRNINAYVPRFGDLAAYDGVLYEGLDAPADKDDIKTLNHLARDDRRRDENGRLTGVEALMTLKGDVDNLGLIFQKGLERPTFAKMAALSRQVNAFFAVWLPWVCQKEFPNTYTVFAGGDDFFLIGPWHSTIRLVQRIRDDFARYVANPDIHFSAGLSMTKSGLPIRALASLAEDSLDAAKSCGKAHGKPAPKNAVSCWDVSVTWTEFDQLMQREAGLARVAQDYGLSKGYLYDVLRYIEMASRVPERPENALWHAHFAYRTRRLAETRVKGGADRQETEDKRRRLQRDLGTEIAGLGIERHGAAYKIALFTHLYQQRD